VADEEPESELQAAPEPEPEPVEAPDALPVADEEPESEWQAAQEPEPEPEAAPDALPVADEEPESEWQAAPDAGGSPSSPPEEAGDPTPVAEDGAAEQPEERAPDWLATEVDDEPEYRDPDESVRLISLARLYRRQGDLDKAAGVYRDLLDTEPDNRLARRELGELCGDGLAEITDEDIIPSGAKVDKAFQAASMETMADARRRKVAFLRSWLEHIRTQD
jgi:hypothetical protein